jgi:hypothetical protein
MNFLRRLFNNHQPLQAPIREVRDPHGLEKQTHKDMITSHLYNYLIYYCSCEEPRYAVLVTGDWGTGKTFQVRKVLPDEKAYYVSLFGLNSTDDVVAAVYAAMFPRKARIKDIADNIGEMTAEAPGIGSLAVNGLTAGLVGAFLRQEVSKDKPIIFDDLERCGLSAKETLGITNLYVEHHGCRVIVIAHDEKLAEEFGEAKEKIFGQTIRVEPQIDAAFTEFHSDLPTDTQRDFVSKYKDAIVGVHMESGAQSLRVLRHVVQDLGRLSDCIDQKYRSHDQAMTELVHLFSAFDIEWRTVGLGEQDLRNRQQAAYAYHLSPKSKDGAKQKPRILIADEKYKSADLDSTTLQDEVLFQMLAEGRYDKAAIEASLDASSYFLQPESSPPWQIVASFDKLDDDVVTEGLLRMQEQFERREVSDAGEMLHIFALRMMMSSNGILKEEIKTVEQGCKTYIDDLLRVGKLEPRGLNWRWYDEFENSAYGIVYWVTEDYKAEFSSVFRYLLDAKNKALELEFPSLASELLAAMEADSQKFYELVCYTRGGDNKYQSIPILAAIAPKDFVSTWMHSPKSGWHWISAALRDRYEGSSLQNDLKPEKDWIVDVLALLNEEADHTSGLARLRIQRTIRKISPRTDNA